MYAVGSTIEGAMRTIFLFSLGLLSVACQSEPENQTCEPLSDSLVKDRQFEAFPSYGSCMEGCAYNEAEGADVDAQIKCVEDGQQAVGYFLYEPTIEPHQ